MKNILNIKYILALVCFAWLTACNIEDLPNPNGQSLGSVLEDASTSQLQTIVTGTEASLRSDINFYYDVVSIFGREYYFFTGSDPRYTGEILGRGEAVLDNAGFYGNRPYFGRYATIRNLNILIESANNSTLITSEEREAYLGFARTIQAYELHIVANMQFENGIRTDVADVENLGPFVDYDAALSEIISLLDAGLTNLNAAGSSFPFVLSSGFSAFSDPASFAQFNRALSARIALYQGDRAGAASRVQASFFDPAQAVDFGPGRFFSLAGGDLANPLFRVPNQSEAIIAHPSFVADATAGDSRLDKVQLRDAPLALDGLSGDHDVLVFTSQEVQIPYINNEELALILAEARIGSDNAGAVELINWVRGNAGIGDYAGGTSEGELIDEIIEQRRYSLYGLGHRWVDMRRYGRLGDLPLDRDGDDVFDRLPRPVNEN